MENVLKSLESRHTYNSLCTQITRKFCITLNKICNFNFATLLAVNFYAVSQVVFAFLENLNHLVDWRLCNVNFVLEFESKIVKVVIKEFNRTYIYVPIIFVIMLHRRVQFGNLIFILK